MAGLGAALRQILKSSYVVPTGAAASAAPMVVSPVVQAAAPIAAGAGAKGVAGNVLTSLGALELLQLAGGLIGSAGKTVKDVAQGTATVAGATGAVGTPVPVGTDTRGYTIPPSVQFQQLS